MSTASQDREIYFCNVKCPAIGRRFQYADELYSDLCCQCIEHAERFPWTETWCQIALIRKARDLMVDELRRRSARARAEHAYSLHFEECQLREPYDTFAELQRVLDVAIDNLPATYRCVMRESLEAARRSSSLPKSDVTRRTQLYRARRMLAEDTCLLKFTA